MLDKITEHKEKKAIIHFNESYSYNDLNNEINHFSKIIKQNSIEFGEIVFIQSDYSFRAIALFLALYKNKNIIVPVTTQIVNEIDERLCEVKPEWIWDLRLNKIEKVRQNFNLERHILIQKVSIKKVAGLILFSSGSTGKPKAMIHDLENLVKSYEQKRGKDLVFLIFLMFDHIGGLNTMLNCLSMGATMVIPENRKPEDICRLVAEHRINVLPSSPTFLNLILISGAYNQHDLSSLKLITYGTEPMPEPLLLRLKEIFKGVKFLQTFGTSETGIIKTTSRSSSSTFLKFDDPDQEYKIVNDELWLRSKTQILGYMNYSNDSFTDDGWFKTGDIVNEIEDGYLKIIGRAKEIINVGGEKVLPEEVESVILELSEIRDCIVFGVANAITGQSVSANILPAVELNHNDIKTIVKKHCRKKMESYKVPVKISIVEKINFSERFKKIR